MQNTIIVGLALVLAACLSYFDKSLPAEAWIAVGALVGLAVKRPGDLTPQQVARSLEAADPTASPGP